MSFAFCHVGSFWNSTHTADKISITSWGGFVYTLESNFKKIFNFFDLIFSWKFFTTQFLLFQVNEEKKWF